MGNLIGTRLTHPPCEPVEFQTDDGACDEGTVLILFPGSELELAVSVDQQGFVKINGRTALGSVRLTDNCLRIVQTRLAEPPPSAVTFDT